LSAWGSEATEGNNSAIDITSAALSKLAFSASLTTTTSPGWLAILPIHWFTPSILSSTTYPLHHSMNYTKLKATHYF
jgi:hypothetical protein